MSKENTPNYYAIIPANVRYDNDLTPNAKLLYAEITCLCNQTGYCWSTNKYFAELYNVSNVSISKWINQLVEKGYINSTFEYKEDTKEIFKRYLSLVNDPIKEKFNTPHKEKLKDNNTSNNNTSNNIKSKIFIPPTLEEVKLYFKENGFTEHSAVTAFEYYDRLNWFDSNNKKVKNWKNKMLSVWFTEKNKLVLPTEKTNQIQRPIIGTTNQPIMKYDD